MRAIAALLRSPLTRNGYALVASTGVTSVLGLVFWAMAARLYPVEQVGLGGVLISALVTIGGAAQLNLTNILNRFIPGSGPRAGKLILIAYAAAASAALVLASGFLFVVDRLVPPLAFLPETPLLMVGFVAAVMAWTIFALQDSALAALRQAVWVPAENSMYAISKIVLLVLFAGTAGSAVGLFAAWTIPLIAIVGIVNLLMFGRLVPAHSKAATVAADISWNRIARFFGWDYAGGLAMAAATGIAPLLVLSHAGPEASASYHIAWIMTYSLYLVSRSMGISLLSEGVTDPARLPSLAADAVVHTMVPLVAAAALVAVGSPLLMSLFGPAYVKDGSLLLTVLAISSIPWGLVTVFLAFARARNWLRAIAGAQAATMVLVLGIGVILLPPFGPLGMAVAWLTAHTVVVIGIALSVWRRGRRDVVTRWGLDVASSVARVQRSARRDRLAPRPDRETTEAIDAALEAAGVLAGQRWQALRPLPSKADRSVLLLGTLGDPPVTAALARVSWGGSAIGALERSWQCMRSIKAGAKGDGGLCLPNALVQARIGDAAIEVDEATAGEDGRLTLSEVEQRPAALRAAAHAISALHARTSTLVTIDEPWIARWVDEPAATVEAATGWSRLPAPWRGAMASFAAEQRAFWFGKTIQLGASHGHLCPENLLFGIGSGTDASTVVSCHILDWLSVRADAPAGFDLCHLALTTRMLLSGENFGSVVRDMLASPSWEPSEHAWLELHTSDGLAWPLGTDSVRALVGLSWLHHVAAHVRAAEAQTVGWLWTAANVRWVMREFAKGRGPR